MEMKMRPVCILTLAVTALAGLIWTLLNAGTVPAYGDTIEYLHAAQSLQVDQYRTILYPFVLRVLGVIRSGTGEPYTPWIYATQWLALVLSISIFAAAALRAMAPGLSTRRHAWLAGCTSLLVATNPLVAHFSVSLMSDSLASTFTLAMIGGLSLALPRPHPREKVHGKWLAWGLVSLFLMALSRVDKLYLAAVASIVVLSWMWWFTCPRPDRRRVFVAFFLMTCTLVAVVFVNKATQTFNPMRPPLDMSSMAFNRVVWPRLSKVYVYLPPEDKRLISPEDAALFDQHNNNVFPLIARVLAENPANRHVLNDVTAVTLRRLPLAVAGKTLFDTSKYLLPNLAFPLELTHILPRSAGTDWTYSRMSQARPDLTRITLWLSQLSFFLVQVPLASLTLRRLPWQSLRTSLFFWLSGTTVIINALLFGLESGMDSHIRYALPTYTILQGIIAAAALAAIAETLPAGPRRPASS